MSLPEYRSSSAAASQLDVDQSALPGYSRTTMTVWDVPPAEQAHQYHLTDKKTGAQWLTMTVMSRASSANEQPTFYQGANIAGSLKLDLEKEVLVDEVTLAVSASTKERSLHSALRGSSIMLLHLVRLAGTYLIHSNCSFTDASASSPTRPPTSFTHPRRSIPQPNKAPTPQ